MRISDWSSDVCSSDLVSVSPGEQDRALRRLAEKRFREISRAFPLGAKAQRLIAAIGKLSHEQTFAPNAPYAPGVPGIGLARSEERRVGKECVSTFRSRWSPYH